MQTTSIRYLRDIPLELDAFIDLFQRSTLAARRPVDDRETMRRMLANGNLSITAWDGDQLVGLARTLTDFGHAAYLADLAVAVSHQRRGIGRALIAATRAALGPRCMLVLLSAPAANDFYPHLGFQPHPRAWTLMPDQPLT